MIHHLYHIILYYITPNIKKIKFDKTTLVNHLLIYISNFIFNKIKFYKIIYTNNFLIYIYILR